MGKRLPRVIPKNTLAPCMFWSLLAFSVDSREQSDEKLDEYDHGHGERSRSWDDGVPEYIGHHMI